MGTTQERIVTFVNDLQKIDSLEEAFNNFIVHRPDIDEGNFQVQADEFISILKLPESEHTTDNDTTVEGILKHFVQAMAQHKSKRRVENMVKLLYHVVGKNVVTARQVSDAVLSTDLLKYDNDVYWIASFNLVQKIIGGVDYKGVREIMKICIDRILAMPAEIEASVCPQLAAIQNLLSYIFNRDSALLPGYFIVNEILKSYPENRLWPHWRLIPMVSNFLNSFRTTAQMVSSINRHRMRPVVEPTGKAHVVSTWKLDPNSLKFLLKNNMTYDRILPYSRDVVEPQKELLCYILRQSYSKELVNNMLGLQKPRNKETITAANRHPAVEDQLARLFLRVMNETTEGDDDIQIVWRNLASQLIFFILFQYVSFKHFVDTLYAEIMTQNLRSGRDELMWALLQYVSGSITKNPTLEFLPILKLYVLYDDPEPLPIPSLTQPASIRQLSAAAVFIHLSKKAQSEKVDLEYTLPIALSKQHEFLNQLVTQDLNMVQSLETDYMVPILCNTFSTCQESFTSPMTAMVQAVGASDSSTAGMPAPMPGNNCMANGQTEPLSMETLDALSVHSKMSLIHQFVQFITKQVNNKSSVMLSPALVETYCRLLVYSEIESLGIKSLLNSLLPIIFKQNAWGFLHMLLEVFSYRIHHVQAQYGTTLLSHLQTGLAANTHQFLFKHSQLNLCVESTTLRLITGLGNSEMSPPKVVPGPAGTVVKSTNVMYGESEELNRVVVLTLARAIHINGVEQQSVAWVKEIMTNILAKTPHSWPSHTLRGFPPIIQDFYKDNPGPKENKAQLKKTVEEEYKIWTSMSNDHDIVQHFATTNTNNSLFLCVLWKMLLETDHVSSSAYMVLERIGAKQLTSHLRTFCDLLVCEFSKSGGSGHVNKCIDAMNSLVWKYNIISLDRLILCMALRTYEGNEAQVCFFIIQLLLLKPQDFRNRVSELVRTMSPEHQVIKDFHSKHMEFHQKFPERFAPDEQQPDSSSLPTYFGNVCLRFIPVFDIVVHRFLELPPVTKSLETLIDHVGVLYKFHDRPISYLYNTLHFYEKRVRDRPTLKKKLISSITGALRDVRPPGWCLTSEYLRYLDSEDKPADKPAWPAFEKLDYYVSLVHRFTQSLQGKRSFPQMDWRFNEFPNEGAHALYVTCVEIMGLPAEPAKIGGYLMDVVLEGYPFIKSEELPDFINSIGLLISNLPDAYWEGLYQKLVTALTSQPLSAWNLPGMSPFRIFNYDEVHTDRCASPHLAYLLALSHSVWHHAGFTQVQLLPELVRERFLPIVQTEEQLLFIYHLTGPFLQRLHSERYMRPLFDLTVNMYKILLKVDKECKHLKHMDAICDILYHVKYQFTGDSVKVDAEKVVKDLRPALQLRLRFIAPGFQFKPEEHIKKEAK